MADGSTSDPTHPTRILARAMYKRLVSEGYDEREIVTFASEIIALLTSGLEEKAYARDGRG